ncbi:MAG: hypothetical protein R2857_01345 [Vampirovibrionales bacterium]
MVTINEGTISSIEFEGQQEGFKDKVVLRAYGPEGQLEVYNERWWLTT